MLLVTVERRGEAGYRAYSGVCVWWLGDNADTAHSALCQMDAKVIWTTGLVEGLYAIRPDKLPRYGDGQR